MRAPLPAARMTPAMRPLSSTTWFPYDLAAGQFPHHPDRVERPNLLALFKAAAVKADWHLGKSRPPLGEAGGEFRFEVEAIGPDLQPTDHGRAIHLVARHQVRNRHVVQHAAGRAHRQVPEAVEPPHAVDRSLEAAAVHDIGPSGKKR